MHKRLAVDLVQAIRAGRSIRLALVGAGGKTTALFQLARQMAPPVLVSASTHLGVDQIGLADKHFIVDPSVHIADLRDRLVEGVNLFTGPVGEDNRTTGLSENNLDDLHRLADKLACPLLVEADGSRRLPLKAPAAHEPPIPGWVNTVAVLVGLSGLGKPLAAETVHRPEIFSALSGVEMGEPVGMPAIVRILLHPQGGLKNIPADRPKSGGFQPGGHPLSPG